FAVKHRLYGENFVVDDKIWTARVEGEFLGLPAHGRRIHVRVLWQGCPMSGQGRPVYRVSVTADLKRTHGQAWEDCPFV
ncbi:MAG: hypothetical protein M3069_31185, partial [Chloroflexota bacterium]|nr:hypothetical protein [Chloroflexota bacterium]